MNTKLLKNIPVLFLLFVSAMASVLLGCAAGGGGGGATATTATDYAPATLETGKAINITGFFTVGFGSGFVYGDVKKTITVSSGSAATVLDSQASPPTTTPITYVYTLTGNRAGRINATNYPYNQGLLVVATAPAIIILQFTSTTSGSFTETVASANYTCTGTFTYN